MHLTHSYPKHAQGDLTRQRILQAVTEDPTATVQELAQTLNLSIDTIRRQKLNLKIAGLLSLIIFSWLPTLSAFSFETVKKDIEIRQIVTNDGGGHNPWQHNR